MQVGKSRGEIIVKLQCHRGTSLLHKQRSFDTQNTEGDYCHRGTNLLHKQRSFDICSHTQNNERVNKRAILATIYLSIICDNIFVNYVNIIYLSTEMRKAADPADISVLFFLSGANFWHMHAARAI